MTQIFLFFIVAFITLSSASSDAQSFSDAPEASAYCLTIVNRRNNKDLYANPADCHTYYQCFYYNATMAVGIKRQCPPTTYWHDAHLQCVPELRGQPCQQQDPCRDESVAALGCYADQTKADCSTYYVCSNEVSYKFCCPAFTRFNPDDCSCIADLTCLGCEQVPTNTTTLEPSTTTERLVINETLCRDDSGNYLRSVPGDPSSFELVDLENGNNTRQLACAPGTSFALQSCACDVTVQPPVTNPRQCSLYLPFDGDIYDDSTMHAAGQMVGNVEINYVYKARGKASLKLFGGWLELPTFKNMDFQTTASWCFFYRCGLDPTKHSLACEQSGGLLSNNVDANATSYSIIVASLPTDRLEARVAFKNPASSTLLEADVARLPDGPNDFQQVCVVQQEAMTNIYVNNQLISTMGTSKTVATSHAPLTIGSDQMYGNFQGYIDEFLFCNFGLTADEVTAHYRGNEALVEAGLIPESNLARLNRSVPAYGDLETEWPKWCEKFKHDPSDKDGKAAFAETLESVKEHNQLYLEKKVLNPMILSKFAAQTVNQRLERNFGLLLPANYQFKEASPDKLKALRCDKLPAYFDWVDRGVVTTPREQGDCGACWAFVATGAIEGQLGIYNKKLKGVQLSIQQLIDCSRAYKTKGCKGGLMSMAYQYMASAPGLHTEKDYPYLEADRFKCKTNRSLPMYGQLFNFRETIGDECNLAFDLMNTGPLSIGMEILDEVMSLPEGTIYSTTKCRKKAALNHALLLVGFGTDPDTGVKYWRIKNSWGPNWCEGGFFRIVREDKNYPNLCGIANLVSSPVLKGVKKMKKNTESAKVSYYGAKDELVQKPQQKLTSSEEKDDDQD